MNKKVSVIIPVYNKEKYIYKCIDSVINQSYKNLEIIIIDDCSSDNSLNIICNFMDKRIKVIKLENNMGVSYSRNIGIKNSSGDYICFLDADDYWNRSKIEKQIRFINKKNCSFIYSDYAFVDCYGKVKSIVHVPKIIDYYSSLKNTTIFISTVMLNMKNIDKKDILMPDYTIGQDTLVWWRLLKNGVVGYGINDVLSYYRVGDKSLSSNKIKALLGAWNIYRLQKFNIFKTFYYYFYYILNAIKRRI